MFKFIFGDPNKKFLNKLQPIVDKINQLEEKFQSFSVEQLKEQKVIRSRQFDSLGIAL